MADAHGVGDVKVEVGVVVRDADAMATFYGDVIGLQYVGDLEFGGGRMRRYAYGDAVVKLVSTDAPPELSNPPNGPAGGASGVRYITLQGRRRRGDGEAVRRRGATGPRAEVRVRARRLRRDGRGSRRQLGRARPAARGLSGQPGAVPAGFR